MVSDEKCSCGSHNVKHEEKIGRGLPPAGYKYNPAKKISWKGKWDVWTCSDCNNTWKKLIK